MTDPARFTQEQIITLASSGVAKIDLLGTRGADRVTTDELVAMAMALALSGVLPAAADRVMLSRNQTPINGVSK